MNDGAVTGRRILLSPPDVGELEQEYVMRAMRSGWVAPAGPDLTAFEVEVEPPLAPVMPTPGTSG